MSRFNKLLSNFRHGELSPKFYGRKDLEEYGMGAEIFDNFIPMIEGGFTRRGGTEYIADLNNVTIALGNDRGPALIPFVVSKDEAYVIAINPYATTSAANIIEVWENDGTTEAFTDFTFRNNVGLVDPRGFDYAKVGDVMCITHNSGNLQPFLIWRSFDGVKFSFKGADFTFASGVFNDIAFPNPDPFVSLPYRDTNISATTMISSGLTGVVTLTSSAAFFNIGHIGTFFRINHGGNNTGIARVTAYGNTTNVTASIVVALTALTATSDWEEAAWSDYRGWPKTVVAHEQRFAFGGNQHQKDTVWLSRLGSTLFMMQKRLAQDVASGADTSGINYFIDTNIPDSQKSYSGAGVQILESDPFSFTLASKDVNPITWMSSKRNLVIGTLGAEYIVNSEGGLSILTIQVREQTSYGGSPIRPIGQANEVLYLSRDGHKLRTFKYNDSNGSYVSANISIMADHLRKLAGTIEENNADNFEFLSMSFQQSSEIIWLTTSSNTLVGVVYSKENGNISWFRTTLPGLVNVWGVCSIPHADGGSDDVWISLERTVDGTSVFYLERIGTRFDAPTLEEANTDVEENLPRFLDSHVKIDNTATSITDTVSGLDHLDNETVKFMYRGEDLGDYLVTAGDITLSAAAQLKVDTAGIGFVGIEYTSIFQSLDVEAGGDLGFSEGHTQRIERADVRYYQTRSAKVGSPDTQDPVSLTTSTNPRDLYSGVHETRVPLSPDKDQKIKIVADTPQPCTVLAIALRGSTDD
tara:strand:+ start:2125 stop:4383 length:2259 start_codon:yes stop_codon:yes gene_type:complete